MSELRTNSITDAAGTGSPNFPNGLTATFTGTPTAPTASVGTNTTQIATTAFVNAEIANDAPTKTGGGASGTWGIDVTGSSGSTTGNAATATNLSTNNTNWSTNGTISAVVGQLAWKNYGNSHTIFDASQSTAPNGSGVNNTNAQNAWVGTFPTLMGWNGANTYGVRVDSARVSDNTSGNAATVSTITTAQVLAAEAGLSAGAVGSYAYCTRAGDSLTYTIGSTIAGSSLRYSNANGLNSGTPGGTWRCMGYAAGTPNSVNTTTLWLRIS
jgi:hypothetical protein